MSRDRLVTPHSKFCNVRVSTKAVRAPEISCGTVWKQKASGDNRMLKCREVEQKIGSGEIAGIIERLAVRFHLMMCRHCRAYARQIRAIEEAARNVFGLSPVDPKALSELKDRIMNR